VPKDIKRWDDLIRIPILSKDDIQSSKEEMLAQNMKRKYLVPRNTSGSLGTPLEFFVDDFSMQWKRGCTLMFQEWTGWKLGERVAMVWGNPEYKQSLRGRIRNLLLERCTFLDTLDMNERTMWDFANVLRHKYHSLLFGHAHSIYLFALFLEKNRINDIQPKGIISSAMILHNWEREKIEQVFKCKVLNRYGCEEVSLIASECEKQQGLHINLDSLHLELIGRDGPAEPGELATIVVTDLTNYGMPFIRYRIGDIGMPSIRQCECGRGFPLMESVVGRAADFLVTPEKNVVSGISMTENFANLIPHIKQLQIIQDAIDHIIIKIVKAPGFDQLSLDKIKQLVAERLGPDMKYSCEYVDEILPEAGGKYRFVKSLVPNPFL
ncbi:MAG: phenylacetate--CoA ligase family protein, partial [Candidatus Hermodarchaeota archaeon]